MIATFAQTQQNSPVYFAAGSEGLNPFMAFFQNDRFVPVPQENYKQQIESVLIHFLVGKKLSGLDMKGKNITVSVMELNWEAEYFMNFIKTDPPIKRLILATSTPVALKYLALNSITLSNHELQLLQTKALDIWKKERQLFYEDQRPSVKITLLTPKVQSVKELPDMITVLFPARFTRDKISDDRGSFFFLFDRKTKKMILSHFGHPEWSPNAPDSVLSIKPYMFFKIGDSPTPYFLADYDYGWESSGLAIINFTNGHVEATTNY